MARLNFLDFSTLWVAFGFRLFQAAYFINIQQLASNQDFSFFGANGNIISKFSGKSRKLRKIEKMCHSREFFFVPRPESSSRLLAITEPVQPKLLILTNRNIGSKAKETLTKYGLKFTPTPRADISELKTDVKKFCRKLRLMEYYADDPITDDNLDPSLVKNPSTFNPPPNRNLILDTYIDYLTKYPFGGRKCSKKENQIQS